MSGIKDLLNPKLVFAPWELQGRKVFFLIWDNNFSDRPSIRIKDIIDLYIFF